MAVDLRIPDPLVPVFEGEARYRGAYGGRGSGKTQTFAKMSALRALQMAQAGRSGMILCCREFQNSLQDSSLEEVKQAIQSEPWLNDYFDCGREYVRTRNGRINYVFSGLRHNIESIKSKAKILLAWLDEAEEASENAYRVLLPTIREEGSELWVTWNPKRRGSATDRRFRQQPRSRAKIVEINYQGNPFFPSELDEQRREDLRDLDPETYAWIWEGAYLEDSKESFIRRVWLDACIDAHLKLGFEASGQRVLGLDPNDGGADKAAAVVRHGSIITHAEDWRGGDVLDVADRGYALAEQQRADQIIFDSVGIGAGIRGHYQRQKREIPAVGFNAGGKVWRPDHPAFSGKTNRDHYSNAKAQAWGQIARRALNTHKAITEGIQYREQELLSLDSRIPCLTRLVDELTAPELQYDGNGRVRVESKDNLKARGIASPNLADAAVLTFTKAGDDLARQLALAS